MRNLQRISSFTWNNALNLKPIVINAILAYAEFLVLSRKLACSFTAEGKFIN